MPAEPQTVALYLGHLAADSKAIATIEQVRAAISHAHGAAEEDTGNRWSSPQARTAVDLAIIGVLTDGGLRRSETAALTWSDVEFWPDGRASHQDPEGQEPA